MASDILLEAGTNEMELLVFKLNNTPFGINVAKVREIIQRQKTITIPHSPAAVEGSFKLRENVLTLINMGSYFGMEGEEIQKGEGMIIVVEFNKIICGVLVDAVEAIHRLRWDKIEPPSQYLIDISAPITGTTQIDEMTVLIADFETLIGEILGLKNTLLIEDTPAETCSVKDARILLADDSIVLRTNLNNLLTQNGYNNLTICNDGQEAWEILQEHKNDEGGPCDIVMTDIEMPRMDGLHLTSKIKEDPHLKHLPVILFSSLITEDNIKKGKSVGADAQISKPDSKGMLEAIERCLTEKFAAAAATA
ncbi:MAG: chemotaxis protein CheV [Planctomycetes bacterium]|nr:chemotaxis protein CheV [Planctomycetota bacterium]